MLGKRKAKATLTFPERAEKGPNKSRKATVPPRKVARKSKNRSRKKKRKIAKKTKRNAVSKRKTAPVEEVEEPLDSVFLQWKLQHDNRFAGIDDRVIIKALKVEIIRFKKIGNGPAKGCQVAKLREALGLILKDIDDVTMAFETRDHGLLCAMWIRQLKLEIQALKSNEKVGSTDYDRHASVVDAFLESIANVEPTREPARVAIPHPRGVASRARCPSIDSDGDVIPDLCSQSSESGSDPDSSSGSETEDEFPAPPAKDEFAGEKPLSMDAEARANVDLIREAKRPEDLRERTGSWVAKNFGIRAPLILDMLQGKTSWPKWSKQKLFEACGRISYLLTQVENREKLAATISSEARKTLLHSEFKQMREIRVFLHLARLGPGGNQEYLAKVTTEAARKDFEGIFQDPKALNLFVRSLESVKAATNTRQWRSNSANRTVDAGSRSSSRRPRTSRRGRGRGRGRGARYYRPLEFRSSGRSRSSGSRGSSRGGASSRSGSRYSRSSRPPNRRF